MPGAGIAVIWNGKKIMMMKKIKQGGKREGSGQKKKYGEDTVTIAFRVPKSKKDEIKNKVAKIIKTYFKTVFA